MMSWAIYHLTSQSLDVFWAIFRFVMNKEQNKFTKKRRKIPNLLFTDWFRQTLYSVTYSSPFQDWGMNRNVYYQYNTKQ